MLQHNAFQLLFSFYVAHIPMHRQQAHTYTYTQCTRLNEGNCWFKSNSMYKCSVMVCGWYGVFFVPVSSTRIPLHVAIVLIKLFSYRRHFIRSIFRFNSCTRTRIVFTKAIYKSSDWTDSVNKTFISFTKLNHSTEAEIPSQPNEYRTLNGRHLIEYFI